MPDLPFAEASFDLALSSHFLFLYTTQLGEPSAAGPGRKPVPIGRTAVDELRDDGFVASIEAALYEFQPGGNKMLRIRRR